MSKLLLPILIISLALWLLLGSFWLGVRNKDTLPQAVNAPVFLVQHASFEASSATIFAFVPGETDAIINDEQLSVLDSLAGYLNNSPEKQLLLTGDFGTDEKNSSTFDDIGIARANSIKYLLVRRGAPEEQVKIKSRKMESLVLNENGLISGGIDFDLFDKDIY